MAGGRDIVAQSGEAGGLEREIVGGGIEARAQRVEGRCGFGEGGDPATASAAIKRRRVSRCRMTWGAVV